MRLVLHINLLFIDDYIKLRIPQPILYLLVVGALKIIRLAIRAFLKFNHDRRIKAVSERIALDEEAVVGDTLRCISKPSINFVSARIVLHQFLSDFNAAVLEWYLSLLIAFL